MMGYVYSAKNNAFYTDELQADYEASGAWPGFFVRVTEDDYQAIMKGLADGLVVVSGKNGYPQLSERPAPSPEEQISMAEARRAELLAAAAEKIAPLQDASDLDIATKSEAAQLLAWKAYRVQLSRMVFTGTGEIDWPEVPGVA